MTTEKQEQVKCYFCQEELLKSRAIKFYHIPEQRDFYACPICEEKYLEIREITPEDIKVK